MKILFAIAVLVVLSESHICLLNPYQRGAEVSDSSFNTEGSEACYLIKGPCGGVNASDSTVREYIAGETMTVTFQKNLNHFYESSPGNFTVRLFASERAEEAEYFGSTADTSSSSLSIYEVTGVIGSGIGGWHVLQVMNAFYILYCLYFLCMCVLCCFVGGLLPK